MARTRHEDESSGSNLFGYLIGICGFLLACIIVFFICSVTIDANERGIKTRQGVIVGYLEPGIHFVTPFIESVHEFKVDNQRLDNAKKPANTYTVDNQEINATYELIYQLPSNEAGLKFLVTEARNYEAQMDGAIINRMKIEFGKVNANTFAKERGSLVSAIENHLKTELLAAYQIKLINYRLLNVDYTESFRKSVNAAADAKAKIDTEANILLQEEKIAEQKRVKANGEADAKERQGRADAYVERELGKARADAAEALGKALAANAALVEYEKAKRWTGALPHYMGIGAVPFMNVDPATKPLDMSASKK